MRRHRLAVSEVILAASSVLVDVCESVRNLGRLFVANVFLDRGLSALDASTVDGLDKDGSSCCVVVICVLVVVLIQLSLLRFRWRYYDLHIHMLALRR